ncbi:MAG TPA: hypothetical protein VGC30_12375 [Dokdonella sp.]
MLAVHLVGALNSPGWPDFWRDAYWATAIAHGERFPLAGPPIYGLFELGPWWFYLLALPVHVGGVLGAMLCVQALAAAKYFLAWRLGTRLGGARLGLAFAASLVLCGWSVVPLIFSSHTAVVETTLLLLAFAAWRCDRAPSAANAAVFGLAAAAALHAHPGTLGEIACAAGWLLWRRRSSATLLRLALAAAIVALALLPPWLDRDGLAEAALKPAAAYLGSDVGVHAPTRIPRAVAGIVLGGAWWGLLLMTPWPFAVVAAAWLAFAACVVVAVVAAARRGADMRRLRRLGAGALAVFAIEIAFEIALRPITPMWMVSACLPPLAFALAIGWYGALGARRRAVRALGCAALGVYVALGLAPFSLMLRDLASARQMVGANPMMDVAENGLRYEKVPVPFYPIRKIARLGTELCGEATLHARLAAVVEATFGSTVRAACGHWPTLRYAGTGGGAHLAGLLPRAAAASGVEPARVVAGMALYERVVPIAPAAGSTWRAPRRAQVTPDSAPGPAARADYAFRAGGGDAVVVTNRLGAAAPMTIEAAEAGAAPAALRADDGGSRVYVCAACAADAEVDWHLRLVGIAANLDVIVLPSAQHASAASAR